MGKKFIPVKTYLVEETEGESTYTYLVIKKPDGTKLSVDIFSGGGYVEQLMFNELTDSGLKNTEVIGNIYENPELRSK